MNSFMVEVVVDAERGAFGTAALKLTAPDSSTGSGMG